MLKLYGATPPSFCRNSVYFYCISPCCQSVSEDERGRNAAEIRQKLGRNEARARQNGVESQF